MLRPSQTKSSTLRYELALRKQFQSLNVVANEVLYCIFKYIPISDLLRCCCVSKTWKEIAYAPVLWEIQFKRLPKQVRSLSSKAKTVGNVSWREECLKCAKKRRYNFIKKLSKNSSLYSSKKVKVPLNRSLDIRWLLVFKDTKSTCYELTAVEDFVFNIGISVRWNDVDIPPLSQMVSVKLYALSPLFFNENTEPVKNSICTRSLVMFHSFKDVPLGQLAKLSHDEHVSIYALHKHLYFGLWETSIPNEGNIAFIGMCVPVCGLTDMICGSSDKIYETQEHKVVLDDVDPRYGQCGYFVIMELRNCRKSFFYEIYKEFNKGVWVDGFLNIEHQRSKDYTFYDIHDKFLFTWKTVALKGCIENLLIFDLNVYDCNQHLIWSLSSPVVITKLQEEQDNYLYEDAELWKVAKVGEYGKCIVEFIRNTSTNESTILSIKIQLEKTFINKWFGTSY